MLKLYSCEYGGMTEGTCKRTRHISYVAAHNEKQARAFVSAYEGKHHKWRIHRVDDDIRQHIIHDVKHRCDLTKKGRHLHNVPHALTQHSFGYAFLCYIKRTSFLCTP